MRWIALVLGVAFNTSAHVLLKIAMTGKSEYSGLRGLIGRMLQPAWIAGGACFGLSVVLYSYVLSKFELSVAQPAMTCAAILLVVGISALFFNETCHWTKTLGIALMMLGIVLVCRNV